MRPLVSGFDLSLIKGSFCAEWQKAADLVEPSSYPSTDLKAKLRDLIPGWLGSWYPGSQDPKRLPHKYFYMNKTAQKGHWHSEMRWYTSRCVDRRQQIDQQHEGSQSLLLISLIRAP